MPQSHEADLAAIARIAAIPTILDVVCRTTGMGFAAVARVTADRWIACSVHDDIAFGLAPGGELKIETTICREIRGHRQAVIIDHVAEDTAYCNHPTPALYGFQSYISVPIVMQDGSFFGTLCAIDPKPHRLNDPATTGMFKLFAQLIASHLDALEKVGASQAALAAERDMAQMREQFIAVLAHDLRNPLASIDAGIRIISRTPINEKAATALLHMQRSVGRMTGLISNVLDFARGRLGGGMRMAITESVNVEPMLNQVLTELRAVWPNRSIETKFDLPTPVTCDLTRIGQLFSNLLGNALTHGAQQHPVRVVAKTDQTTFEIQVINSGDPIPDSTKARLFQPFFRGELSPNQQGLGLGLFIAAEIARSHNGTLEVSSAKSEICFTFRMPVTS
jgi:signal transduction histidine kinase